MKLIYRGTTENYDPAQTKINHRPQRTTPYELSYRGNRYRVDPTTTKPTAIAPRSYELMYRGNSYQVSRDEFGEMTNITCSTKFFQAQTRKPQKAMLKVADQSLR
jgi:hypothetical protein